MCLNSLDFKRHSEDFNPVLLIGRKTTKIAGTKRPQQKLDMDSKQETIRRSRDLVSMRSQCQQHGQGVVLHLEGDII